MFSHYTVLKEELVSNVLHNSGLYVDGTLGGAGHTKYLLEQNQNANVIGIDKDSYAIENAQNIFKEDDRVKLYKGNYADVEKILNDFSIDGIDGLMLDLGFSSPQIDLPERGFSYMHDGPLDMRMDTNQKKDASFIVNNYSEKELNMIFRKYGEEKNSKRIAKNIVLKRKEKKISTTFELVKIIDESVPHKFKSKGHDAKKIFQAIRIEVNDELKDLEKCLNDVFNKIKIGGRVGVITFHSLEDKMVKYKFKEWSSIPKELQGLPSIPEEYLPKMKLITNKSIKPTEKEIAENSRSKSANLRVVERVR